MSQSTAADGPTPAVDNSQLPSLKDVTDDELEALIMRKVFVSARAGQAQALNLLNLIRGLFIGLTTLAEFERVLALASVERLFGCIQRDDHKLDTARFVLDTVRASIRLKGGERQARIADRRAINFLLKLFQIVNNTLSPLADQDELDHLGQLTVFYVELFAIDDIQQRLELYSRCRSCVGNLHVALEHVVRRVLELPEHFRRVEKKRSARQNFLNGCLAFALVTIPALYNKLELQLELSQLGCELALERSSVSLANFYLSHILVTLKSSLATATASEWERDRRLMPLVDLFLKHQAHIDLKHKMKLTKLIRSSCAGSPSLLQSLKHLDCLELFDDNEKYGAGNKDEDDEAADSN